MRQIRIDYRQPVPASTRPRQPAPARAPRHECPRHHGVLMVLAGTNLAWNTVRYLCPLCNAAGLPLVEVATGVISGYWPERGFGFIENGGPRIFFHVSDLTGSFTPYVGLPVTCRVETNERGLIGRQVSAC